MHFVGIQAPVTHQLAGEQQHGNFVAIANARSGVGIDIEHIDAEWLHRRQRVQFREHLLAQAAERA